MFGIHLAVLLLFARGALSYLESDPEFTEGFYQGDIRSRKLARNGIAEKIYRWPNATIHYAIQPDVFDTEHLAHIMTGMAIIEEKSCIRFKEATKEQLPLALKITGNDTGCNTAALGFRKINEINLHPSKIGFGCFRIGSILHEFLHALGFEHQHVSQDRDEYVRIEWENIAKGFLINFVNDDNSTQWHGFGEKYDYDSVMHYVPTAFSKNGNRTIVALKEGSERMGQREEISITDVRKLNKMYQCPGFV